jgi:hypothetical protein
MMGTEHSLACVKNDLSPHVFTPLRPLNGQIRSTQGSIRHQATKMEYEAIIEP